MRRRMKVAIGSIVTLAAALALVWLLLPSHIVREMPARISGEGTLPIRIEAGHVIDEFDDRTVWGFDAITADAYMVSDMDSAFTGSSLRLFAGQNTGAAAWITLAGRSITISDQGTFTFWVDIKDATRIDAITIYLADKTDFTRYFAGSIDVAGILPSGPQMLSVSIRELHVIGGMTVDIPVGAIRLRIDSKPGGGSASFDHLTYQRKTTPQIVISFDDNWMTQYTEAFQYMKTRNIPATIYVIRDLIGADRYMNLEQLQEVYAAGWDIGNHSTDHLGFNNDTDMPLVIPRLKTVAARQTPKKQFALNGNLSVNGRALLASPRVLVFRLNGNETGKTVLIEGTDAFGRDQTEAVALAPDTLITSSRVFGSVTAMTISSPASASITVGISQGGETTMRTLRDCSTYLVTNGMPRGAYHHAYPMGQYNVLTHEALRSLNFKTARTISGRPTPTAEGLLNPFAVQAFVVRSTVPLASATNVVDLAIRHGATAHIVFHRIEERSSVETDWSATEFRAFIDYVARQRDLGLINTMTISAWHRSIPVRRLAAN